MMGGKEERRRRERDRWGRKRIGRIEQKRREGRMGKRREEEYRKGKRRKRR